jgi:hypothetical protein
MITSFTNVLGSARLVVDEKDLQRTAYECGSLPRLAELLHIVTPGQEKEWPDDEPEIISRLREVIISVNIIQ